ncbi:hypothetical protein McanMca71_000041 [Microsporum canis]|uniref:Small s protein n=1 Tax=Arthroderma otae (strain ATCC MYA-4605 / CBS 113480) TaxID=554155 RepID=C5FCJ3_ARTOC|nr:small s protein [Microsporum canis CBS 113480]EEQ27527.1 small s protein [Microsporum canis CBS 113480]
MAEAVGLAVGIIGLAGLFNNAVQCFEYVQLARSFGRDFQSSQLKLDSAQLRLSRWGKSLRLDTQQLDDTQNTISFPGSTEDAERAKSLLDQISFPGSIKDIERAKYLLSHILELFEDAETLSSKFKDKQSLDDGSTATFDPETDLKSTVGALHRTMRKLATGRQNKANLKQKAKRALYAEKTLRRLVEDITEHVDDLTDLFPATLPRQKRLCEAEASEIGKHSEAVEDLKKIVAQQDKLLHAALEKSNNIPQAGMHIVFSGANNKGFQAGQNFGSQTINYNGTTKNMGAK